MIEDGLTTYLLAQAGITAIVGDRIYPQIVPQEKPLPAITFETVDPGGNESLRGPSSLSSPTIRVTAWAEDYLAAKDLGEQVRLAMARATRGLWGDVLVYGVSTGSGSEPGDLDPAIFAVARDFTIWHRETVQ